MVYFQILDKRHSQEILNLDETFAEERKVGIDAALSKLEEEHNQQIDELRAKHEKELKALEGLLFTYSNSRFIPIFHSLLCWYFQSYIGIFNHILLVYSRNAVI